MPLLRLFTTLTILVAERASAFPALEGLTLSPTYSIKSHTNGAIDDQYIGQAPTANITLSKLDTDDSLRLVETYDASNWFSKFNVKGGGDPTHGFVNYLDQSTAQRKNLYRITNNQIYMGVDSTTRLSANAPGRDSVRVESKNTYTHGLFITSLAHIPGSNCGSWPAFWTYGQNWPSNGEIDILEGVHSNQFNTMTLHTSPGCSPGVGPGGQIAVSTKPGVDCGAGGGYDGCGMTTSAGPSYGTAFNAAGGGYYAMLWTSSAIKIWYFPKNNAPADIASNNPNPNNWGAPLANWGPGCNYDSYFRNHNIVFDITFCGDWAGKVWGETNCAQMNPSCNAYVAEQPQSFGDSYWLIDWLRVYS